MVAESQQSRLMEFLNAWSASSFSLTIGTGTGRCNASIHPPQHTLNVSNSINCIKMMHSIERDGDNRWIFSMQKLFPTCYFRLRPTATDKVNVQFPALSSLSSRPEQRLKGDPSWGWNSRMGLLSQPGPDGGLALTGSTFKSFNLNEIH